LKSTGSHQYWLNPSDYFDNSSGFSAVSGFGRNAYTGTFSTSGTRSTIFWSSSQVNSNSTSAYILDSRVLNGTGVGRSGNYVRCIKD
jgi:uncharacterized protein (TIGR02145 family)